jgi:hypothetical protein
MQCSLCWWPYRWPRSSRRVVAVLRPVHRRVAAPVVVAAVAVRVVGALAVVV